MPYHPQGVASVKHMFRKIIILVRKLFGRYPMNVKNPSAYVENEDIFDDGTNPFED
jgi:hypothetical protein